MQVDDFTIGLVQHRAGPDADHNLATAIRLIREVAGQGAQIICLQELFRSPYFCTIECADFFDLAEDFSNSPTIGALVPLARELQVVLVVPFFERRAAGIYHNSAAVIDADGSVLGPYRKMHIPDDPLYYEKYYFTPGDARQFAAGTGLENPSDDSSGFRTFKTRYATIGILICWDQWYPEGARITALMGAEVIFFPTAIGWHPFEKESFGAKQLAGWQTIQRSHAIANGLFVASVNRVGHEQTPGTEGIEFFGHSFIADPFGEVVAQASAEREEVLIHRCSRKQIESTRRNWPFLRDRRIDAYGKITARYIGSGSTRAGGDNK